MTGATFLKKILLICFFTAAGFFLLSLNIATAFKFYIDPEGRQAEHIINVTLLRYKAEYMYLVYYGVFFPLLLILESLFIKTPLSRLHKLLFIFQSLLQAAAIYLTLFALVVAGISDVYDKINWYVIIGVEIIYLCLSISLLFAKGRSALKFFIVFQS